MMSRDDVQGAQYSITQPGGSSSQTGGRSAEPNRLRSETSARICRLGGRFSSSSWWKWLPAAAVILALSIRRSLQMGFLPTGLDGGEWLAIGRGLSGGQGRQTDGAYAPLIPASAHLLATFVGPTSAIHILAILSLGAVLGALTFVLTPAHRPWLTAGIVLAAGGASAMTEPVAFGGYPQHFALAAGLIGISCLACFLLDGRRAQWIVASAGFSVAALSHHIYFPLVAGAGVIATCAWAALVKTGALAQSTAPPNALRPAGPKPARDQSGTTIRAGAALCTLVPGLLLAAPTLLAFQDAGYAPPLDAAPYSLTEAWRYATREAVTFWTAIVMAAPIALAISRRRIGPAWLTAAGLYTASTAAFLAFGEPRLAPAMLISALLAIGEGLAGLPRSARLVTPATVATVAVVVLLGWRGDGEATAFFRFYRVLDDSTLAAARAVDDDDSAGAVAVRADRRGWPVGWWYEGLTTRPVLVGSDPRWLGFPGERRSAKAAESLFDGSLTPNELRTRAGDAGVTLLICRKWEWIGWERWLTAPVPAVEVIHDDDVTLILRLIGADLAENGGV